jgi:intracellular septation protein
MRTLLGDLGAGVLFFVVLMLTDDIYKATAAGMLFGLSWVGLSWLRKRKVEPMQWLGTGFVLLMGGATIIFHDPRFVMFKPTIFFAYHGMAMLKPGWMYRYLPLPKAELSAAAAKARHRFVVVLGVVYCSATLGLAVTNTLVAMYATQKGWALFNAMAPWIVYGGLGSFAFIGGKILFRRRQSVPSSTSEGHLAADGN